MKSTTQLSVPEMIALIISVISLVISIIALVINIIKTRITIKEYKKSEASGTSESKSELKGVLEKVRELPDIDLEFHNRENFITMSKYLIEKIIASKGSIGISYPQKIAILDQIVALLENINNIFSLTTIAEDQVHLVFRDLRELYFQSNELIPTNFDSEKSVKMDKYFIDYSDKFENTVYYEFIRASMKYHSFSMESDKSIQELKLWMQKNQFKQ